MTLNKFTSIVKLNLYSWAVVIGFIESIQFRRRNNQYSKCLTILSHWNWGYFIRNRNVRFELLQPVGVCTLYDCVIAFFAIRIGWLCTSFIHLLFGKSNTKHTIPNSISIHYSTWHAFVSKKTRGTGKNKTKFVGDSAIIIYWTVKKTTNLLVNRSLHFTRVVILYKLIKALCEMIVSNSNQDSWTSSVNWSQWNMLIGIECDNVTKCDQVHTKCTKERIRFAKMRKRKSHCNQ